MNPNTHLDFRLVYNGERYTARAFCAITNLQGWLLDVQSTISFWLDGKGPLEIRTSGSTGAPKTIELLKTLLQASAEATNQYFELDTSSKVLLFLPAKYVGGKMVLIRAMIAGSTVYLEEPSSSLPITNNQFDFVSLTPMQAGKSVSSLNKFNKVLLGGGPIGKNLEDALQNVDSAVYHGYGMTETASHVALRRVNGGQLSDRFQAVAGVRFSVNEHHCLIVHAPGLSATPFVTNDVVDLVDEYHFVWKGRIDHAINSGGLKIHPEEVEELLIDVINKPYFVAGLPDTLLGERLTLFIESAVPFDINFSHLPGMMKPKETKFLPAFTYTETDKIDRISTVQLSQNI